jgi:hypothetical protein
VRHDDVDRQSLESQRSRQRRLGDRRRVVWGTFVSAANEQPDAVTWPRALFELANLEGSGRFGERLAVCTRHRGQHVRHGRPGDEWCQALPPHRRGPRPSRLRGEPATAALRVVVELDTEALGEAIGSGLVLAFRRARAEERAERRP